MALSTPLIGRGGMVARLSWSPQSCGRNTSSFRSFNQEQDHVVAETGRHELEAPKPNHRGARNQRNKSGHLERDGKSAKKHTGPLPGAPTVGVFPRGVTPTSKTCGCSPFQMVMQERHRDLSWFGQEKALHPAGGRCFYYLAPKCLYRGEYKLVLLVDGDEVWLLFYVCLVFYPFLSLPIYSSKGRPRLHA